jgi:hypothetical protein
VPSIGIEAPPHVSLALHLVEGGLAANLLVSSGVAAPARIGQRADATVFDELCDIAGGRRLAEIEEQLVRRHTCSRRLIVFAFYSPVKGEPDPART